MTDTPTPTVNHDLVEHDQPNHEGNSCKQSKNKQEQDKQGPNSQRWGSEYKNPDGLVDTRVFKEVAMAKLTSKQNPN